MPDIGSPLIAAQFLTRLPGPTHDEPNTERVGSSIAWFPVVGLLIGGLLVGTDALGARLFARPVVDAILVFALVSLTGALHIDGLVDTADGLSAGPDAAARLAAMRMPTAGVPGALAGCVVLFATFAALASLPDSSRAVALLLAPTCGRAAILLGYRLFPYPRPDAGVSRALKASATTPRVAFGLTAATIITAAVGGPGGVILLALSLGGATVCGALMMTRVPGVTGDGHGAICEITQLAALILAPTILAL